jgi:hypothetical protein
MARRPEVRNYYDAAVRNGTCRRAADNLAIQIEQEAEARRLAEQPESIEESVNRKAPPVYDVPVEGARKWQALVDAERGSFAERREAALVAWAKRRPGWDWIDKPPPQNEILAAHRKDFGTIPGLSDNLRAVRRALAPDEAKRGGRHFHRG